MGDPLHLSAHELADGLAHVRAAPSEVGMLDLVVRRPGLGEREVLDVGQLDLVGGLLGDTWPSRPSRRTQDGGPHPDMQLNVVSSRVVALVARTRDRWALAGDQLYVDLDLSVRNLPAGTRLGVGAAVIEVTDQPHLGCAKFVQRFGIEAQRWVSSDEAKELRLRGLNARVVVPGPVRPGDAVVKLDGAAPPSQISRAR